MENRQTKQILIDGIIVGRGTSVKIQKNLKVNTEDTFDGPVVNGQERVSYTVDIGKIVAPDVESYLQLRDTLNEMETVKKPITIKETHKSNDGSTYTVTQLFINCLVDSFSQEISVDKLTTESISFTAEDKEEDAIRNH